MELPNNSNTKLSLADAPWIECECESLSFKPSLMFKRVSQIISPSGKEEVIPVEIFKCTACGLIPAFVHKKIPGIPEDMKAIPKKAFNLK
jgi:hypothetical protein